MKTFRFLLTLVLTLACYTAQAQGASKRATAERKCFSLNDGSATMRERIIREKAIADSVNVNVDVQPVYPGGETALLTSVAQNLVYPAVAIKKKVQGIVLVKFLISSDGSVIYAEIQKPLSPECDQAAIDIVKKFQRFTPAKSKGQAVPMWYTLPIRFRLQ